MKDPEKNGVFVHIALLGEGAILGETQIDIVFPSLCFDNLSLFFLFFQKLGNFLKACFLVYDLISRVNKLSSFEMKI